MGIWETVSFDFSLDFPARISRLRIACIFINSYGNVESLACQAFNRAVGPGFVWEKKLFAGPSNSTERRAQG
jgi:hypothetical protein